ncbi:flagellar basal body L-ring protein FlgH [Alienimonas californiensis]|uniref:Flagellar L-ring protein n=1 Tax=Alienimonas californiensis TaxID=2527989 RepID=A0A517P3Y6_9PLAN|nr:flagellar basal body L-ring protein FlgH [Alienimonas californiensis]QDT14097.1 Flagellar L-ring protein precursor [Alienimonas californiensis]
MTRARVSAVRSSRSAALLLGVGPLLCASALCPTAFGQGAGGQGESFRMPSTIDPRSPSIVPTAFPQTPQIIPAPAPLAIDPRLTVPPSDSPAALPQGPLAGPAPGPAVAPARPVLVGVRPGGRRAPQSMRELSLTHISLPEARTLAVHDIITVLVDEKSEVAVQSRFDRRRNSALEASINEFVRLDPTGRLILSATGEPSVDLESGVRIQATGSGIDTEAVRYRIAAEVVDVLPNGNVVLEARKEIRNNRDVWEYTLTGTIAAQKVNRDLTAQSEDVANLKIEKRAKGKIYSSTARPWGIRVFDLLWPF